MTEFEKSLLQTLLELERAAAAMPTANPKPDLAPLFERLDDLVAQLPTSTEPMLVHYLQRKSYQKAREFLESR